MIHLVDTILLIFNYEGSTPPSTEARKRSPEFHSGNEERKKRQKELQWVALDLESE